MTAASWKAIATRIEAATGADKSLDCAVIVAIGRVPEGFLLCDSREIFSRYDDVRDDVEFWLAPEVTSDLSAIVALIERELPGWGWRVAKCHLSDDAMVWPDFSSPVHGEKLKAQICPFEAGSVWDVGFDVDRRPPGNVALALCQAFCLAMAARAEQRETAE